VQFLEYFISERYKLSLRKLSNHPRELQTVGGGGVALVLVLVVVVVFNLSKLNELEVRKQYQVEITNWFAALENLNEDEDVNRIWGNIKHNIQTSAEESLGVHEWKQHKPWFDEECLAFLDQRKRAQMQWVQDP